MKVPRMMHSRDFFVVESAEAGFKSVKFASLFALNPHSLIKTLSYDAIFVREVAADR